MTLKKPDISKARTFAEGVQKVAHDNVGRSRDHAETTSTSEETLPQKVAGVTAGEVDPEQLINVKEACKFLNTSRPSLYRLLKNDELTFYRYGKNGSPRFDPDDLRAFLKRSKHTKWDK